MPAWCRGHRLQEGRRHLSIRAVPGVPLGCLGMRTGIASEAPVLSGAIRGRTGEAPSCASPHLPTQGGGRAFLPGRSRSRTTNDKASPARPGKSMVGVMDVPVRDTAAYRNYPLAMVAYATQANNIHQNISRRESNWVSMITSAAPNGPQARNWSARHCCELTRRFREAPPSMTHAPPATQHRAMVANTHNTTPATAQEAPMYARATISATQANIYTILIGYPSEETPRRCQR